MKRRCIQLASVLVLAGLSWSLALATKPVYSAPQVAQVQSDTQRHDQARQEPRPTDFFTWQQVGTAAVAGAAGGAVAGAIVAGAIGTPSAAAGAAAGAAGGATGAAVATVVSQVVNHFFGGPIYFAARPLPETALN
jgi:hypothetical protein